MCKCTSFVLLGLVLAVVSAQQYDVGDPQDSDFTVARVTSANGQQLLFDNRQIIVDPNERVEMSCGVNGAYRSCVWEKPDGTSIQVADIPDYTEGLSRPENQEGNQCGVVINSAVTQDHGKWICKVYIPGDTLEDTKDVIVTIQPTPPRVDQSSVDVNNIDDVTVQCSVAAARPPVVMKWYLGDRDITSQALNENTPTDEEGTYKSLSTLSRVFQPMDNGQKLACSVEHHTLEQPLREEIEVFVEYAPVPAPSPVTTFYEMKLGMENKIVMNVSANPDPFEVTWHYGPSFQSQIERLEGTDENADFRTEFLMDAAGNHKAILYVKNFKEPDVNIHFVLRVANNMGDEEYKILLSMDEKPADGDDTDSPTDLPTDTHKSEDALSGGAVAGIVIVVLLIVAAVCLTGFFRYKQMYCFAPDEPPMDAPDPDREYDTESAHAKPPQPPSSGIWNKFQSMIKSNKNEDDVKMDKMEEGDTKEDKDDDEKKKESKKDEKKSTDNPKEVVYAELDLKKGNQVPKVVEPEGDKTEYAEIVGTVQPDNKQEEKKE